MNNYDSMFFALQNLLSKKSVFQSLPSDLTTPYPFAVLEDGGFRFDGVKIDEVRTETLVIDLWHTGKKRKELEKLALQVLHIAFAQGAQRNRCTVDISKDTSTSEVLWRATIEVVF